MVGAGSVGEGGGGSNKDCIRLAGVNWHWTDLLTEAKDKRPDRALTTERDKSSNCLRDSCRIGVLCDLTSKSGLC